MSAPLTRATLLARVFAGDEAARTAFAALYRPVVYRFALQLTKGRESDADDITQHVITKFGVEKPILYDPRKGTFRGLLNKATKTRFLDLLKKLRCAGPLPAELLDLSGAEDITDRELAVRELQYAWAVVRNDFDKMTQTVFEQVSLEGRPAVEVAAECSMEAGAVRAATKRVRDRLREELERRGINSDGFA